MNITEETNLMSKKESFTVLIIDNFHMDPEEDYLIEGFPTKDLAVEFARRWVRESLEENRKKAKTAEEIRKTWRAFGENAVVLDGNYRGSSELDYFILNPATKKEQTDWKAIKKLAGLE